MPVKKRGLLENVLRFIRLETLNLIEMWVNPTHRSVYSWPKLIAIVLVLTFFIIAYAMLKDNIIDKVKMAQKTLKGLRETCNFNDAIFKHDLNWAAG